ncbi:hypothetical protein M885DRAFT_545778 [Pelagophyceae sp. CCMP2097]|nr:hypothetical protein M885DRAFT_545778 [Pelagophyceae sp. CCMP2097]
MLLDVTLFQVYVVCVVGAATPCFVGVLRLKWVRGRLLVLKERLARRRGIIVGRHPFVVVDAVRSLVFSVLGAKRAEVAMITLFVAAVLCRKVLLRTVFGRTRDLGPFLQKMQRHFARRLSTWAAVGGLGWFCYWRTHCCERPLVSCRRTFWNVAVVEKAGLAKREFKPVFWLTSRHAQTVIAHILADLAFVALKPVKWRREAVPTYDGGEMYLDWISGVGPREFEPYGDGLHKQPLLDRRQDSLDEAPSDGECCGTERPVILLMYGIGGTRDDHYMKHMATACRARGWRAVVLSYWRLDVNNVHDVKAAVATIGKQHPRAPLFIVAHSASAYLLVQYLAEVGSDTNVVAAVTVAGCLDFVRAYDFVRQTKNRSYRKVFDRGMRRCVRRHAAHDPALGACAAARRERAAVLVRVKSGDVMYDRHIASIRNATDVDEDEDDAGQHATPGKVPTPPVHAAGVHVMQSDAPRTPKRRFWRRSASNEPSTPLFLDRTKRHYMTPSRRKLAQVQVPLLVLHSRDDPLVSHDDCYDWVDAVANPHVIAVRTNRGGHLGWHEGVWPMGPSWAVGIVTDYISAVLEQTAQTGYLCAVFEALHAGNGAAQSRASRATASKLPEHFAAPAAGPPARGVDGAARIAHAAASRLDVVWAPRREDDGADHAASSAVLIHNVQSLLFDDDDDDDCAPSPRKSFTGMQLIHNVQSLLFDDDDDDGDCAPSPRKSFTGMQLASPPPPPCRRAASAASNGGTSIEAASNGAASDGPASNGTASDGDTSDSGTSNAHAAPAGDAAPGAAERCAEQRAERRASFFAGHRLPRAPGSSGGSGDGWGHDRSAADSPDDLSTSSESSDDDDDDDHVF